MERRKVQPHTLFMALASLACCATSASAADSNFFAGLDFAIGAASGSSNTVDGGAPFAGGGIVTDVDFGGTRMIGGHVGYRLTPALSLSLSYRNTQGDIRWNANFPLFAISSAFQGSAISNAILGNLALRIPLSTATAARLSAGAGLSFNKLSGVAEIDRATGIFLADIENHTKLRPTAQIGIGLRHHILPRLALGLDGSLAYAGGFETGTTRSGNLGITDINPYAITDVWRKNIGVSLTVDF